MLLNLWWANQKVGINKDKALFTMTTRKSTSTEGSTLCSPIRTISPIWTCPGSRKLLFRFQSMRSKCIMNLSWLKKKLKIFSLLLFLTTIIQFLMCIGWSPAGPKEWILAWPLTSSNTARRNLKLSNAFTRKGMDERRYSKCQNPKVFSEKPETSSRCPNRRPTTPTVKFAWTTMKISKPISKQRSTTGKLRTNLKSGTLTTSSTSSTTNRDGKWIGSQSLSRIPTSRSHNCSIWLLRTAKRYSLCSNNKT